MTESRGSAQSLVETPLGAAAVSREGKGTPVLLVHSLLTDSGAWDYVAPTIAARHAVYRLSLPGFGASPALAPSGERLTIAGLADFVAGAIEAAVIPPEVVVIGNGLGGFVVVALAARHPQTIGGLIAANCGAAFPDEARDAFGSMAQSVERDGMAGVVDVAVRRIFTPAYLETHPDAADQRRDVLLGVDPAMFAAFARALADLDLGPELPSIAVPTLIVAGSDDQTTPPAMARALREGIPNAQLATVSGVGHCPPLEKPPGFLAAITPFLEERVVHAVPQATDGRGP